MEIYSSQTRSVQSDECCGKGHRPSLLLWTATGCRICLLCASNLISDRNAFLIHRLYAVEELSMALTDSVFSSALFDRYPKFFVSSLSDAIGSSVDQRFCESVTAVILSLCRLSRDTDESLVEDFIRQTVRQLGCPSLWRPSKCLTLHLIGLLLELHCEQEFCVPLAIKNQKEFVPNLIAGLQLPGEELHEEIFYIHFKLASLEDGVELFLHCSHRLCQAAIQALLKTESDSLRINCIALLSAMASRSTFDIRFAGGSAPGQERNVHSSRGTVVERDSTFVHSFAEAMKASLLSPDLQVQESALQLIYSVFPKGVCIDAELQILVDQGIVDYIFEVIRLLEKEENIQELAVDVLILLSAEERVFPHRFKVGLDTLARVLARSIDAHSIKLQTSILHLLSRSLSDITETLSTARAEELVLLLTKILHNHVKAVEDHALIGDINILSPTFNFTCLALISLTQAPSCAGIPNVNRILETATESAIVTASSAAKVNPDPSSLTYSASLLQEVYKFNKNRVAEEEAAHTTEALIRLCEFYLLPALTDNLEKLDDERLVLAFLETFTLILNTEVLESLHRFALKLTSNRCFTLTFELIGRFPSRQFKESAYKFMSGVVAKLTGCSIESYIEESLDYLAMDPYDLLLQVEHRNAGNQQLLSAQHASIAILSTSYTFNDRLAKETDIVASLEQHLLVNRGSALVLEATLKQFISLYAGAKDAIQDLNAAWSAEAEKILEAVVAHSSYRELLCSEIPKPVLKWFLRKESLKDVTIMQLLTRFTAVQSKCFGDGPQETNSSPLSMYHKETGSGFLEQLADLIGNEDCGTTVLVSLLDSLVVQGKDIVAQTFTKLARMHVPVGRQLIQHGIISTLQQSICTYGSKDTDSIITSCLELLFQLLYDSDSSYETMSSRSWRDIANQCATLVLRRKSSDTTLEVVAPLSLINLILQKSYESGSLTQACEILVCNRDLCAKLEGPILDASSQGAKLSKMDSKSVEEELLCGAAIFCLLRLRCALRFELLIDNLADEKQYVGFNNPSVNRDSGPNGSSMSRTSLTCEHWCRVLYFGPPSLKTLACCSIAEIFSQLPASSKAAINIRLEECNMPPSFLMAVTMVLQGSILGECEQLQKTASCCLSRLLHSHALSLQQKQSVASSPWNHLLLENLVSSLSSSNYNPNPGTIKSPASFSAAYVAVGLLKMSPPPPYLSSLFSEASITNIISNLCEADISPVVVSFFHELLLSRYLTDDHLRTLRDLFQETRKIRYGGEKQFLHRGVRQSKSRFLSSKILNVDHTANDIIHSAILELAITCGDEALEALSNDGEDSKTLHTESPGAFTSFLDAFMQDSCSLNNSSCWSSSITTGS
ncbi:unnamed protein product [Calypogeia fissa]